MSIHVPGLVKQLENKHDLIFSEENLKKIKEKINLLTSEIVEIRSEVITFDSKLVNIFPQWEENFDAIKNISDQLKTKQNLISNEILKDKIDNVMCRLDAILSECEILFPSKKVGLQDWNKNKEELFKIIESLKQVEYKTLTLAEIVDILQLVKIPTSEDGLFKQFAVGINKENQNFTDIFYLIKSGEVSFFHRLDVVETWTWLGGEPLSLFQIENNKLIEQTLDQSTHTIPIPCGTWFAAIIKEKEQQGIRDSASKKDFSFSLVSCQCTPAFTMNCFHNNIDKSFATCYQQATVEDQARIYKLLTPEQRIELNEQSVHNEQSSGDLDAL